MKYYEGMFILHNRDPGPAPGAEELPEGTEPPKPPTPEEVVTAMIEKSGGKPEHTMLWANRKLSYPIAGNQTGSYVICYYSADGGVNDLLNREVHLSDRCLRSMSIAISAIPAEADMPEPLAEPNSRGTRRSDIDMPIIVKEGEKPKKLWELIDYKHPFVLRRMISAQGKLFSRVRSNLQAKSQRKLRQAVHRARNMALLPFVGR